jgi:diacylglycerol kinase (ATP)
MKTEKEDGKGAMPKGGLRHLIAATANSLRGLRDAFRTAAAFRQECLLGVIHYAALAAVPMRFELRLALAAVFPLVLAAELLNSAVEAVVDLVSPEWNLLARYAKDFGSAAVFVLLALVAGLWIAAILL